VGKKKRDSVRGAWGVLSVEAYVTGTEGKREGMRRGKRGKRDRARIVAPSGQVFTS